MCPLYTLKNVIEGFVRIARSHVAQRGRRYIADFFNTMLDIKWRYVLFIFTCSFFGSWLAFAAMWYAIAYFRGDLVRRIEFFKTKKSFNVQEPWSSGYG